MRRNKLICLLFAALLFLLVLTGCESGQTASRTPADGETLVTFLDTGQSNATLIQPASGENILIDTGDTSSREELIQDLKDLGVDRIDLLVITHWHLDHAGGAVQVMENFPVDEVFMTDNVNSNKTTTKALETIQKDGIQATVPKVGESRTFGDTTFTVVGPVESYKDQNESSIVIRMTHGGDSFLFPGDMEGEATESLVESGQDLTTNVLLAPHHGSAYAVSEEFWDALGPNLDAIVVECGKNNKYGHPHKEVLQYAKEHQIPLYRTDEDGEIQITSNGNGVEVVYVEKGDTNA